MPEKIFTYVGKETKMFNATKFAYETLLKTGQVYIAARGLCIPRAIQLAHRLETGYAGIRIANESTRIEDLADDGRKNFTGGNPRNVEEAGENIVDSVAESEENRGSRVRHVAVYEARLILQKDESKIVLRLKETA